MSVIENYRGSNCTGSNGATSRTLTISNTIITIDDGFQVFVNGVYLHPTADYTVDHNDQSTVITFLNAIFNDLYISVNYSTAGSPSSSSSGTGVLVSDQNIMIKEIDYLGDTVTLRVVTDSSYSKWGDATESTADTASVKAIVNDITPEEQKELEGVFANAEKRFYFKPDQGNITEGNRIVYNSVVYEIVRTIEHQLSSITWCLEAWGKKT